MQEANLSDQILVRFFVAYNKHTPAYKKRYNREYINNGSNFLKELLPLSIYRTTVSAVTNTPIPGHHRYALALPLQSVSRPL